MNWEALGAISELLAAISVFVTLIYLAIQVKENNKVQTINTYNAVVGGFSELYSWAGLQRKLLRSAAIYSMKKIVSSLLMKDIN